MKDDLLHLIADPPAVSSDEPFNDLALRIFRYQYQNNLPYRRFCLTQRKGPETVTKWRDIPRLPVTAFKYFEIACRPLDLAVRLFYSSGTTHQDKSCHALFDHDIAKWAILSQFKKNMLPERDQMTLMMLTPSPAEAPHASLTYMMEVLCKTFGTKESRYYVEEGRLQSAQLMDDSQKANQPICLLGTSFSFVHFFDDCQKKKLRLTLPKGSRLMDTGGFKGKSRTVEASWIYKMAAQTLGIAEEYCVNEYGMSEMTSQFYDHVAGVSGPRVYHPPPQVRTLLLSPETLAPVSHGEVGLLAHLDLANIDSAMALLTEDLGRAVGDGFVFLGRASEAERKGCSMAFDEFLEKSDISAMNTAGSCP